MTLKAVKNDKKAGDIGFGLYVLQKCRLFEVQVWFGLRFLLEVKYGSQVRETLRHPTQAKALPPEDGLLRVLLEQHLTS